MRPSSAAAWATFWASSPTAVGIDVEGNQQSPPVLVQIATASLVILEVPAPAGALSPDLARLLSDDSIAKIFCENSAGKDKWCLGLATAAADADGMLLAAPVVELEHLANVRIGIAKVPRGFARILTVCYTSGRGVRIAKDAHDDSVHFFAAIEQGFCPQLRGLHEVPQPIQEYAALDAWATLLAWVHLSHDGPEGDKPAWSHVQIDHHA
jgi:hypothetical protein